MAALYTEDAVLLPPNSVKVYGKEEVKEFWGEAIFQLGLKEAIQELEKVVEGSIRA